MPDPYRDFLVDLRRSYEGLRPDRVSEDDGLDSFFFAASEDRPAPLQESETELPDGDSLPSESESKSSAVIDAPARETIQRQFPADPPARPPATRTSNPERGRPRRQESPFVPAAARDSPERQVALTQHNTIDVQIDPSRLADDLESRLEPRLQELAVRLLRRLEDQLSRTLFTQQAHAP